MYICMLSVKCYSTIVGIVAQVKRVEILVYE